MEKHIKFKDLEDASNQITAEIHWRGISFKKIVLVFPILSNEDTDQYGSGCWDKKAIERHYEGEHNVKWVHLGIVELWFLHSLVQLDLKQIYGIVWFVTPLVTGHTEYTWNSDKVQYLVYQPISAQGVVFENQIENEINKRSIEGFGKDSLDYEGVQSLSFSFMSLEVGKHIYRSTQSNVDDIGHDRHDCWDYVAFDLVPHYSSIIIFSLFSFLHNFQSC